VAHNACLNIPSTRCWNHSSDDRAVLDNLAGNNHNSSRTFGVPNRW
jgi:hypothetical protein